MEDAWIIDRAQASRGENTPEVSSASTAVSAFEALPVFTFKLVGPSEVDPEPRNRAERRRAAHKAKGKGRRHG